MKSIIKKYTRAMIYAALFLAFIIVSFLPAFENRMYADNNVLRLRDFIENATRNNPEIFQELEKLKESDAQVLQAKAVYDVVFNVHYNRIHDSYYKFSFIDEQDTDNAGAGLQWTIPYAGTRLKAGMEFNRAMGRANVTKPNPTPPPLTLSSKQSFELYNPQFSIEVQQPLLRNWLGIVDRFPIRQAALNKLIMKTTVDESIETIISDLYKLYFDWYLEYRRYDIYARNVINSQALIKTTADKFRAGLADNADVAKTKIMNLEFLKARDLSLIRLQNLAKKIYIWNSGATDTQDVINIIPEENIEIGVQPVESFSIHNSRQMKLLDLNKEVLAHKLKKDYNELLPELNLNLSYRANSYSDTPGKSFDNFNYNNYTVGAELNFPVGLDMGKGKVDETKARLKEWDSQVKAFERSYKRNIEDLRKTCQIYETLLKHDADLAEQAAIQLREEEKKYQQGRSDLYFIIEYKNSLLKYELLQVTDMVDLKKVYIELLGLMDGIVK